LWPSAASLRYKRSRSISIGVFLELWAGYSIRDNLTLNVINLIYQFDFIRNWQSGGPAVQNVPR
jgi:hypothetical protein